MLVTRKVIMRILVALGLTPVSRISSIGYDTGLVPLEREPTLTTAAYSTTCIRGKPTLIHAVMDPSEAIDIGR
jgi:hypothetical protein